MTMLETLGVVFAVCLLLLGFFILFAGAHPFV
jgi:hypothetical protein